MYVPFASPGSGIEVAADRSGIFAWTHLATDDKQFAIVEFVAGDRKAFAALLADKSIQVFQPGKDGLAVVEATLKVLRKDFDLSKFHAVVR